MRPGILTRGRAGLPTPLTTSGSLSSASNIRETREGGGVGTFTALRISCSRRRVELVSQTVGVHLPRAKRPWSLARGREKVGAQEAVGTHSKTRVDGTGGGRPTPRTTRGSLSSASTTLAFRNPANPGGLASRHGSLTSLFQEALHLPS